MTETSARLTLPFILPGQAQKEIYHNEALALIDISIAAAVTGSADLPPASPAIGECWLVGSDPDGAWTGNPHAIAGWTVGGWRFVRPVTGMAVWRNDLAHHQRWTGAAWDSLWAAGGVSVGGAQVLAGRQPAIAAPAGGATIDGEARAAIGSIIAALMSHGLIE